MEKGGLVTKKPIVPSPEELKENPRARSAKLRVFEIGARDSSRKQETNIFNIFFQLFLHYDRSTYPSSQFFMRRTRPPLRWSYNKHHLFCNMADTGNEFYYRRTKQHCQPRE